MHAVVTYLRSSLGRKYIMGLTGLGLCGFVLTHMAGNLLIFAGADAYNTYGYKMLSNPAIRVAEFALAALFLVHIGLAVTLHFENSAARPNAYQGGATSGEKAATAASRSMIATGAGLAVFLIIHLNHFRFDSSQHVMVQGVEMHDLYGIALTSFKQPGYLGLYTLALVLLAVHLKHGLASAFQSLGLTSAAHRPTIELVSRGYAAIVSLGFLAPLIQLFLTKSP